MLDPFHAAAPLRRQANADTSASSLHAYPMLAAAVAPAYHSSIWLNDSMDQLNEVLGAISHPTRRAIIARLAAGPARVTEISRPFAMSLNAISKHLKVLEHAGLIRRERHWRDHIIEFRGEPLRAVAGWLHIYEEFWNEHLDTFEAHFREKNREQ
jgi:DNA-binding transcriptional ArsR family regulator